MLRTTQRLTTPAEVWKVQDRFEDLELLSRVGDRPTATILQAQFHFCDFCLVFYCKIFEQNMALLEGPVIV